MGIDLIYGGHATLDKLLELHEKKGMEFIIEDGVIKNVIYP